MISSENVNNINTKEKDEIRGKKIAFFVKSGGAAFLSDIINWLSKDNEINLITIKGDQDLKLIDKWMNWSDISWFEWCDSLIIYGSKLAIAKERFIICRLHSYEAFTNYPAHVKWNNVDKIIFIAEHIRKYVMESYKISKDKTTIIPNGVDLNKWTFRHREPGFNVAYVGYINYKKGPMLLLHTFKALYDRDNRYMLYIAGQFQDARDKLYFHQMIKELGLENNLIFDGWQKELDSWLENKNYILCSSVLESQNMSVMQAITKGIKPIIHNFVGANEIYPKEYLWNTIEDAVRMITNKVYDSEEYRRFIGSNYSLVKQKKAVNCMISHLINRRKRDEEFNYKDYWNKRLTSNFSIEGVGYIGLGEIYNKYLYQNRLEILDGVLSKAFSKISHQKVLELGPGTGIFTDYFHSKGIKEYKAIDLVEKSVNELSRKYNMYQFKQGDISDCYNYDGKYDLIFAAAVLLHITSEEKYKKAVTNIGKHLGDNGICILLDPVSVINTKSQAPHVVIRDVEYIKKVLEYNQLELIDMLPVAYFMNYPFDREVIGTNGKFAIEAFQIISRIYTNKSFGYGEKQLLGKYLLYKEQELLYEKNIGLSEKMLIIRKKGSVKNSEFSLKTILNIEEIRKNIRSLNEIIAVNEITHNELFNKINVLLNHLQEENSAHNS